MSNDPFEAQQRAAREKVAEYLLSAFVWDYTPFPDLSKEDEHGDKWRALYRYLRDFSEEEENA